MPKTDNYYTYGRDTGGTAISDFGDTCNLHISDDDSVNATGHDIGINSPAKLTSVSGASNVMEVDPDITDNNPAIMYNDFAEGWNIATAASNAAVKLLTDWEAVEGSFGTGNGFGTGTDSTGSGAILVPPGKTITLDLNGYTINRNLTQGTPNGNVITVKGALTIEDNSNTDVDSQGKITGGYNKTPGTESGGGIVMVSNSTLTLESGNIVGNKSIGWGGGVKNEGGTFTMTGGKISGNVANYSGDSTSKFNNCGGGVYVGGSFTMTGGEISDNFVCGSGGFRKGGGVFFYGSVTVGGKAVIRDNKSGCTYSVTDGTSVGSVSGGITDNVYLRSGTKIYCSTVTPLASGASIGVTTETSPAIDEPVNITDSQGKDKTAYFHSDNSDYTVTSTNEGLQLKVLVAEPAPTATFTATGADSGTLSNVTTTMKYSVDDGISWTAITGTTMNIFGVTAANGVKIYQPGDGSTTSDSTAQTITITKAATPSLTATQPGSGGGSGSIPMTEAHEYSADAGNNWTIATGTTTLAAGTYLVRIRATGTVLASDNQILTIAAYSAPPSGGGSHTSPATVSVIKNGDNTTVSNLKKLISGGINLTVEADNGAKLVFDTNAIKGISGQSTGKINVEMKDVSHTHQENLHGKRVFSLTVSSESNTISNFGGSVLVSLPYELQEGESADEVTVWNLLNDGTMTEIPCTYDPATKLATFKITHFSLYVVGVNTPWSNPFADVKKGDWFYDAVEFVNRYGLMQGISSTEFASNKIVTRNMLITILYRLENMPQATQKTDFIDVADDAWYADSVAWASSKGIVTGYEGKFDPDGTLTREQMAAILYRYATYKNLDISADNNLSDYTDMPSDWALSSVKWAVAKDLIKGNGCVLNPMGGATRAESATILQRFIENTAK